MRPIPRSILGQLITGSVVIQMAVFAAFLSISIRREVHETRLRDRQRLEQQTKTIAGVLGEPLLTANNDMLDHIVHALPVSPMLSGVRITDPRGQAIRTVGNGLPPALTVAEQALLHDIALHPAYRLLHGSGGADEGEQAVVADGTIRGIVWVAPDNSVTRRYWTLDLRNLATYAGCALLGNLLLVWWLSNSVARPLRALRRATQQIEHNPDDLSAFPLPGKEPNEAGELQASFNAMVNEIALRRRSTQETLNLLDSLLESAPVGFAFFDREFRFVRVNSNLAAMNGVPPAAHLGKRYRDLLPPGASMEMADQTEALVTRVFDTDTAISDYELSGVRPGSSDIRTWQVTLFPVRLADERVRWVGVIAIDKTERRLAEEGMRRSERQAAAGRLAASIAHEINNPLESITNLLYLLRLQTNLDEESQEYLALAQSELTRVAEITQQTLKFYRRSTVPTDVRMPDLLRSVLLLHQARMQSPRIDLRLRLNDTAISFGYPGELRQVFANLIGNAIDAMPAGGSLHVRARSTFRMGVRGTRVTVADTGVGMSDAVRRRIFEPFFTTKEFTGTGLGLWVSDEILTKHRAHLSVRSSEARQPCGQSGTVFAIFFPYHGVPRGPVGVINSAQGLASSVS